MTTQTQTTETRNLQAVPPLPTLPYPFLLTPEQLAGLLERAETELERLAVEYNLTSPFREDLPGLGLAAELRHTAAARAYERLRRQAQLARGIRDNLPRLTKFGAAGALTGAAGYLVHRRGWDKKARRGAAKLARAVGRILPRPRRTRRRPAAANPTTAFVEDLAVSGRMMVEVKPLRVNGMPAGAHPGLTGRLIAHRAGFIAINQETLETAAFTAAAVTDITLSVNVAGETQALLTVSDCAWETLS